MEKQLPAPIQDEWPDVFPADVDPFVYAFSNPGYLWRPRDLQLQLPDGGLPGLPELTLSTWQPPPQTSRQPDQASVEKQLPTPQVAAIQDVLEDQTRRNKDLAGYRRLEEISAGQALNPWIDKKYRCLENLLDKVSEYDVRDFFEAWAIAASWNRKGPKSWNSADRLSKLDRQGRRQLGIAQERRQLDLALDAGARTLSPNSRHERGLRIGRRLEEAYKGKGYKRHTRSWTKAMGKREAYKSWRNDKTKDKPCLVCGAYRRGYLQKHSRATQTEEFTRNAEVFEEPDARDEEPDARAATRQLLRERLGYLVDPHTANDYLANHPLNGLDLPDYPYLPNCTGAFQCRHGCRSYGTCRHTYSAEASSASEFTNSDSDDSTSEPGFGCCHTYTGAVCPSCGNS